MANTNRSNIVSAIEALKQVGSWPKSINEAELRDLMLPLAMAAAPQILTIRTIVANLAIVREDVVLVNCTTNDGTGVAVTLPASPVDGQVIVVKRIDANGGTDDLTVTDGADLSEVINTQHSRVAFTYSEDDSAWSAADPVTDASAAYQLDTEAGIILADNDSAVDLTLTLPLAAEAEGRRIVVKAVDAGNSVIVDGSGAETVDGAANVDLTTDLNWADVVCDGAAWYVLGLKVGA